MKKYVVSFESKQKIQIIKMMRVATRISLMDAKEFVEQKILPQIRCDKFSLLLTELQVGRLLIYSYVNSSPCFIENIKELEQPNYIDVAASELRGEE